MAVEHPWYGRRFSAGWGAPPGELDWHPVRPDLVVEFLGDTAVDTGRYRPRSPAAASETTSRPTSCRRIRDDVTPDELPPFAP
ncbi:hypothetical protein AB0L35_10335 [Streptomyces sp. NPDC052309]|uniref:hypothetical protein n=1 Tax=Streptomyces sp. NPDC052309 TaxID=3155421 RepID=UPI0034316399